MAKPGSKERIRRFLRARIGQVVTAAQLQEVAQPASEWARRVRELREDEGWPIHTNNDDNSLSPGQYRLDGEPPDPSSYRFTRPISKGLRARVIERNGYTCQMCGAGAGDDDPLNPGRTVRLQVGHIKDRSHGGKDEMNNLRALCSTCNQGARNLVQEPPSYTWLLGQIRRATVADQRKALEWLSQKFGES